MGVSLLGMSIVDKYKILHPKGRFAVITGASAGIGAATAEFLAADGWDVVLAARREEKLREVEARIVAEGGKASVLVLDATNQQSIDAFTQDLEEVTAGRGIDLLVNNAGGARGLDPVLDADPEDWRWMFEGSSRFRVR